MNAPGKTIRQQVSAEEWQLRVDLAACYRAVALYGWDDLIYTHISARIPGPEHHFLINPYGLMFEEITASSLIKVDMACQPLHPTEFPVNPAGFTIHSAIHAAREDIVCVLHTHTPAGVAVAAQKGGLLPISQQASIALQSLAYHEYEGLAVHEGEKARLQSDLGNATNLILRNHGLLTVGKSVGEAFTFMFNLERACQVQVMARSGGAELLTVTDEVMAGVRHALQIQSMNKGSAASLSWPAVLRKLDRVNPGYAD
jgi:ribulose-5-phosphate 4-epimerase/fuculose-1-phosphate aldolase